MSQEELKKLTEQNQSLLHEKNILMQEKMQSEVRIKQLQTNYSSEEAEVS